MAAPLARGPVILIVQPERDDGVMYAEFLESEGLLAVCVSTAADGLSLAEGADVIVTGILLPGRMDGVEFVARLRHNDRTNRTPIIVLTTAAWNTERLRAKQAGCNVFLSKPCLPGDLLREIRRLLASAKLRGVRGRAVHAHVPDTQAKSLRHRKK